MSGRSKPKPRMTGRDTPKPMDGAVADALEALEAAICSDEEVAATTAEQLREARRRALEESGILEALPEADRALVSADRLRDEQALVHVRKFMAQTHWPGGFPYLALMGGTGTGKTVAAAWGLTQVPGRYIEAQRLCILHEARYKSAEAEFRRVVSAGLLVIDELGTEESRERAQLVYRDVLNRRQHRSKPTVLLGNLEPKDFWARFDVRTQDRLRVRAYIRGLRGESLRRRIEPQAPPRSAP